MSVYAARGANPYLQTQVQSRTPLELVVMLYDGAIRFLGEARDGARQGDVRKRANGTSRALAIVDELQNTLDMNAGGDIARSLDQLYTYVRGRLLDATIQKGTAAAIEEALRVMTTLREGWIEISSKKSAA
jgi:flagellar protein FliS